MKSTILRLTALSAIIVFIVACQKPPIEDFTPNSGNGNPPDGWQLSDNFDATGADANVTTAIQTSNQSLQDLPSGFGALIDSIHARNNGGGFTSSNVEERGGTVSVNGLPVQKVGGWLTSDWSYAHVTGFMFDTTPSVLTLVPASRDLITSLLYNETSKKYHWANYVNPLSITNLRVYKDETPGLDVSWGYHVNPLTQAVEEDGYFWHPEGAKLEQNFFPTAFGTPVNNQTVKFWNLPDMTNTRVLAWHAYEGSGFTKPPTTYQDMSAFTTCFQFNKAGVLGMQLDVSVPDTAIVYVKVPVAGQNGTQTVAVADHDLGGWTHVDFFVIEGEEIFQIPGGLWVSNPQIVRIVSSYRTKWSGGTPSGVLSACKE